MILEVKIHPDPILRQICAPVTQFDKELLRTIDDMFDTMVEYRGIGLAAPQVGILQRILVLWYEDRKLTLINPEITSHKGTLTAEEGCLSLPHIRQPVTRHDKIVVTAQNKTGKKITLRERGIFSRIIQHEMDHLNGKMIIDYPTHEKE